MPNSLNLPDFSQVFCRLHTISVVENRRSCSALTVDIFLPFSAQAELPGGGMNLRTLQSLKLLMRNEKRINGILLVHLYYGNQRMPRVFIKDRTYHDRELSVLRLVAFVTLEAAQFPQMWLPSTAV